MHIRGPLIPPMAATVDRKKVAPFRGQLVAEG